VHPVFEKNEMPNKILISQFASPPLPLTSFLYPSLTPLSHLSSHPLTPSLSQRPSPAALSQLPSHSFPLTPSLSQLPSHTFPLTPSLSHFPSHTFSLTPTFVIKIHLNFDVSIRFGLLATTSGKTKPFHC
jgi:hypothetical protein